MWNVRSVITWLTDSLTIRRQVVLIGGTGLMRLVVRTVTRWVWQASLVNPWSDVKVVSVMNDFELLERFFRNHLDKTRIEFLCIRHDKIEDFSSKALSILKVVVLMTLMVLHRQGHVIVVYIWIFSHEINKNLLLLSVLEDFLSKSLEILSQISVFLQWIFNFVDIFLRVHTEFEIQWCVEELLTIRSDLGLESWAGARNFLL